MVDAFSSEGAEETSGTKPNFIGRIVSSNPDGGEHPMREEFMDEGKEYFQFLYEIEVLDKDWKNQLQYGVAMTNNFSSRWMFLIGHLENIHGPLADNGIEGPEDLAEFLEGRVYEFREINWKEDEEFVWEESPGKHSVNISEMFADSDNQPNEFIAPVREVGEDELADIDQADESEEVEEVEL